MIALLVGSGAYGAVEEYTSWLAAGAAEAGMDVTLVHHDVPALARFESLREQGVRLRKLDAGLLDASSPVAVLRLRQVLRELRPQVVHITDVWALATVAARIARVPRVLVTHHTPDLPRRDSVTGRVWNRAAWAVRPRVIYISEAGRTAHGVPKERSTVIHSGVNVARYAGARHARSSRPSQIVGTAGRLAAQKGLRYLVDAAPVILGRHDEVRFVIAGDGELRQELEGAVNDAGLERQFEFPGHVEDVPAALEGFDLFVLPSLFEGLPHAVIEAQAAGLPVVASAVGGVPEIVDDGVTGVLVPPRDSRALAEAVSELLDSPERMAAMGERAARRAAERFDRGRMVKETLGLYEGWPVPPA